VLAHDEVLLPWHRAQTSGLNKRKKVGQPVAEQQIWVDRRILTP